MRSASAAALRALSTPTAATGTPGGICAIASSASRPSSTLRLERNGTPITGRSVCAATTPGSAAERPAPQMSTRNPRLRALRECVRRAVRRAHLELVADLLLVEELERRLHALAVRLGADEDADDGVSHSRRCRGGTACRRNLCARRRYTRRHARPERCRRAR